MKIQKLDANVDISKFQCAYCKKVSKTLKDIVEHCKNIHSDNVLKYRELSKDNTGSNNYGYWSKLHESCVPSVIKRAGKYIVVNENVVLIREKKRERSILSTPTKLQCT